MSELSSLDTSDGRTTPKKSARETAYSILNEDELPDGFIAHLVVPDVLQRPPPEKLPVSYGDSNIDMGNLLTAEDLRYRPVVNLERTDSKKFYTLIMTDPDVPNRAMPTEREHLHWLIVNITEQNLSKGEEIVSYKAPLPNLGSGLHRYVFVLLEQSRPIKIATESEKQAMMKTSASSNGDKKTNEKRSSVGGDKKAEEKRPSIGGTGKSASVTNSRVSTGSTRPTTGAKSAPVSKDEKNKGTSTSEVTVPLIQCIKFSTKEFMRKYAILGVVAGSFFQTEYNDYVGKQKKAEKKGLLDEEKKIESVKKVMKVDEKKTIDSMQKMKISK